MAEEIAQIDFQNIMANVNAASANRVTEYEKELEADKLRIKKEKLEENYKKYSGVPMRYWDESLETYKPTQENRKCYEWLLGFTTAVDNKQNSKNIVYLNGKFGTGKTHLGCGIIRRLGGKIMTSLELCITYDSCRDFKSDETRIQFLKRICNYPVLVIDEVGKGVSNIEKEILPFIVNEFYGSGRILIFLGNENKEDFNKIIGEAGKDRMNEVGVYFALIGESCRKSK